MNLKIGANVKGLVKGLNKAQKESKKTGVSVKKLGGAMAGAAVGVKALDLAGRALTATFQLSFKVFKDSTLELAKFGDRMAKQARMVGVTAEQYQGYEFAAQRAGTSVQHVANGLKKLGRVMTDAQQGSRQLEETFESLGIEIANADGTLRPVNDVFLELADKSEMMGESAERTGTLMLLLGRSGTEMANMMENGADGIKEVEDRLRDLNAMMSAETLADSEALIDAQADLEIAFRGMRIELGKEVIPELVKLGEVTTNYLVHMSKTGDIEDFGKAIANSLRNAAKPAVALMGTMEMIARLTSIASDAFMILAVNSNLAFSANAAHAAAMLVKLRELPQAYSDITDRMDEAFKTIDDYNNLTFNMFDPEAIGNWVELSEEAIRAIEGEKIRASLADRKRRREEEAAAKRRLKASEREIKRLEEIQVKSLRLIAIEANKAAQALYDTFYKTPESELTVRWAKEHETITAGLRAQQISYQEATRLRGQVDRNYEQGKLDLIRESAAKQADIERQAMEKSFDTAGQVLGSFSQLSSAMSDLAMIAYERGDEEAKKHAVALFHVSQAFALATAAVNTAMAVSQALATPPVPNIPLGVAAGVAGAAQIATIVGTSIQGIGDAGITSDMLKKAGLNNHSAIVMRNDETLLDPVGTKHITEMLAMQKAQMQNGGGEQTIRTTVELDGQVLGQSVDNYLIRQQERGLAYGNRVRQEYV
jgi:hypothetical protein